MNSDCDTLVVIATYNEISNLPQLVDEVFQHAPDAHILVVDDNSPDGTGQWCQERASQDHRLRCLHRPKKLGLGTATFAGFCYALEHQYDYVLTMDADFSHQPRYIAELRAGVAQGSGPQVDVMIGSRYIAGGGIEGWPLYRRGMSRLLNFWARMLLHLPVRDCSGAFRCYRSAVLSQLDFDEFYSTGYSYLEEILWRLDRYGARFAETPIVFVDRAQGKSKISWREAVAAAAILLRLSLKGRGSLTPRTPTHKKGF